MVDSQSPIVGQWTQFFRGGDYDFVVLNVDCDMPDKGRLSFWGNDRQLWIPISLHLENDGKEFFGELFSYDSTYEEAFLRELLPHFGSPTSGNIKGSVRGSQLKDCCVKTDGNINFEFELTKSPDFKATSLKPRPDVGNWKHFKEWVAKDSNTKGKIFRGQKESEYKLTTSFHRTGRSDLARYLNVDMHELKNFINSESDHYFDFHKEKGIGLEIGALLNLAQHHGFPTPFLDWTESPYIAAYFAYSEFKKSENRHVVSVFTFYRELWERKHKPTTADYDVYHLKPKVTVRVPAIINNDRAMPQQSVSMLTNLVDIEGFIEMNRERDKAEEPYLRRIDLPVDERDIVMKELRQMGIHAGSMFPGLEGICKSLREKNFPFPE